MRDQILAAFDNVVNSSDSTGQAWVTPYAAPASSDTHQFVLFFKPEVTQPAQGAFLGVLDLTLQTLKEWEIELGAVRILRGDYLEKHRIMDQHYGVLNAISKQGVAAISPSAREKLEVDFADDLKAGAKVLGGHQFLAEQPEFSALALSALSDNLGGTKLGGGTYAVSLKVKADSYILLNSFHAYQLEPFCKSDNALVVFDCRSSKPWKDLRSKLAGATNPTAAEAGSIRNQLLKNQAALKLADVSQGANGIHLSAGPLEGMVEAQRFFSDHDQGPPLGWTDFAFGSLLQTEGLKADGIEHLTQNPLLEAPQGEESAFDITEEVDAAASATALAACLSQSQA